MSATTGSSCVAFALLAYVPFLLSSPGRVTADTKQYLYLDPDRLLSRARVPLGLAHRVRHRLAPDHRLPVPDGAVLLAHRPRRDARLGRATPLARVDLARRRPRRPVAVPHARRLARRARSPARSSTCSRPTSSRSRPGSPSCSWRGPGCRGWSGLAMRAVRRGGWRDPALFALVILTIGSVNASSLVFVCIGPALWLVVDACRGRDAVGPVVRGGRADRGLEPRGLAVVDRRPPARRARTGCPILQLTETVRTVAADSSPTDILRGIGNWFFYGKDRLGLLDRPGRGVRQQRRACRSRPSPSRWSRWRWPRSARWRHRAYFVLLVVVGTVVSIGAWPYDDPSPYGALFKWFAGDTAAGLALRNTPRAVPLLVLGPRRPRRRRRHRARPPLRFVVWPPVLVGVLALAALAPVLDQRLPVTPSRPRRGRARSTGRTPSPRCSREGNSTRILEIPGSDFSAYRWGDTIEPITPGLTDRPYVARETLPSGSAPSVNLLVALDHRLQDGTFEPDALAAYARLANIGTDRAALRPPVRALRHAAAAPALATARRPRSRRASTRRAASAPDSEPRPATGAGHRLDASWRSRSTPPTHRRSRCST